MGPTGVVEVIQIAPAAEADITVVREAHAVPGRGLEGDRYFRTTGTYSRGEPAEELTLIEAEAIDAVRRDSNELLSSVTSVHSRRNIVTRGVALNHLVGREFWVGTVQVRGIRLCEPCSHMARLAHAPSLLPALVHRGGLRAQILTEGTIRVGDVIADRPP